MTKQKAREILPAIVDNEASAVERSAFFDFIKYDAELNKEYKDALLIKKLYKTKLKRAKAPEHLKNRINKIIAALDHEEPSEETLLFSLIPGKSQSLKNIKKTSGNVLRYTAAAAAVLFIILITIQLLDLATSTDDSYPEIIVENMVAKHFLSPDEVNIKPLFKTNSRSEAEAYLADQYGFNLTIPEVTGAEFAGVIMAEFIENFSTPLLKYEQQDINEKVYIFVMNVDDLSDISALKRLDDAVKSCIYDEDFYVTEIDGHHVVSWMWNGNWYTAISNHNGYDLATLVEPLHYTR